MTAFTEPLSVFFGAGAEFAVSALYKGAITISGVFDNGSGASFGIAGTRPRFSCKATDVPSPARGDALVVNAINYQLADWTLDDTQTVIALELERQ